MTNTGNFIARFFSVALQPLLMPLYSVALLFVYTNFYHMYMSQILRFLLPVFTFTFLLPSFFIFILWKMKYVTNLNLSKQYERILPYIIFIVANLSLAYFYYYAGVFLWFIGLVIAPAIVATIGFIINFFCKISAHMMGIGGLIGAMMSVCFNVKGINPIILFIGLFFLAGCLGVSVLYMKRNKPSQVYTGFVVGFITAYACIFISVFTLMISYT